MENGKGKEEEEKQQGKGKKALILLPIALLLTLSLSQCTATQEVTTYQTEDTSGIVYEVDDPAVDDWLTTGAEGQEEQTAAWLNGDSFHGEYYDGDEQASKEETAIEGHDEFQDYQSKIAENMAILQNPDSTREEVEGAIAEILAACESIDEMYAEKRRTYRQRCCWF